MKTCKLVVVIVVVVIVLDVILPEILKLDNILSMPVIRVLANLQHIYKKYRANLFNTAIH